MPAERVDQWIPVKPSACHRCGQRLTGEDPHPRRHQQVEIPPVRAQVIEYQLHTLRCPACDRLTEADWPSGVSRRTFGPRVQAWVSLLAGAYRLSQRNIVALLSDAFGVELSVGTVSPLQQQVSAALGCAGERGRRLPSQSGRDGLAATPRQGLVVDAVTAGVSVFAIRPSRGREVVEELLGADSPAVVGSDRYSAYGHRPPTLASTCWNPPTRCLPGGIECPTAPCNAPAFQDYARTLRGRVRLALWSGQQFADARTAATCGNLLDLEPALWTFARRPGVEPTNNEAERVLRHGVLWRQLRQPQCRRQPLRRAPAHGARHPAPATAQLLDYLTTACHAALHQQPAPSLLPQTNSVLP